jgi:hypothetical protein
MLKIRRREGQVVEVTDRAGNRLRIHVETRIGTKNVWLAFEDDARNFEIARPGREEAREDR